MKDDNSNKNNIPNEFNSLEEINNSEIQNRNYLI